MAAWSPHRFSTAKRSRPARRSDEFAGERSRGNGFPCSERIRLLQPLLPHPKEGWWSKTILNLRHLNRTLMKRPFRMFTSKQILSQICPGDWLFSLDLKNAYFHIQLAPHHRRFLRLPSREWLINTRSSPLGLSLAPLTFMKFMDVLFPAETDGNLHLELPQRILVQSEDELLSQRSVLHSHLECLGFRVKRALSPQPTHFIPGNSYRLSPKEGGSHARICTFMSDLRGHHVLVRSNSMMVVSYINRQGETVHRLRDASMPLSGLSSPPSVLPVIQTQFM